MCGSGTRKSNGVSYGFSLLTYLLTYVLTYFYIYIVVSNILPRVVICSDKTVKCTKDGSLENTSM